MKIGKGKNMKSLFGIILYLCFVSSVWALPVVCEIEVYEIKSDNGRSNLIPRTEFMMPLLNQSVDGLTILKNSKKFTTSHGEVFTAGFEYRRSVNPTYEFGRAYLSNSSHTIDATVDNNAAGVEVRFKNDQIKSILYCRY
jgi:hypothetical protein